MTTPRYTRAEWYLIAGSALVVLAIGVWLYRAHQACDGVLVRDAFGWPVCIAQ